MQPQAHDPDVLRQAVLDIMVEAGHSHLLPKLEDYATDKGSEVNDIDTPPMSPSRRVIIEAAQKMQPEPQGPTAEELLNPMRAKSEGIACQAVSHPLGLCTASVWPADGRAKTPTREQDEPLRHSRSLHRRCGGGAQSLPVGYESTYCQERQKGEKQRRSETLKRHLEKREAEKQEVLTHSCSYIS